MPPKPEGKLYRPELEVPDEFSCTAEIDDAGLRMGQNETAETYYSAPEHSPGQSSEIDGYTEHNADTQAETDFVEEVQFEEHLPGDVFDMIALGANLREGATLVEVPEFRSQGAFRFDRMQSDLVDGSGESLKKHLAGASHEVMEKYALSVQAFTEGRSFLFADSKIEGDVKVTFITKQRVLYNGDIVSQTWRHEEVMTPESSPLSFLERNEDGIDALQEEGESTVDADTGVGTAPDLFSWFEVPLGESIVHSEHRQGEVAGSVTPSETPVEAQGITIVTPERGILYVTDESSVLGHGENALPSVDVGNDTGISVEEVYTPKPTITPVMGKPQQSLVEQSRIVSLEEGVPADAPALTVPHIPIAEKRISGVTVEGASTISLEKEKDTAPAEGALSPKEDVALRPDDVKVHEKHGGRVEGAGDNGGHMVDSGARTAERTVEKSTVESVLTSHDEIHSRIVSETVAEVSRETEAGDAREHVFDVLKGEPSAVVVSAENQTHERVPSPLGVEEPSVSRAQEVSRNPDEPSLHTFDNTGIRIITHEASVVAHETKPTFEQETVLTPVIHATETQAPLRTQEKLVAEKHEQIRLETGISFASPVPESQVDQAPAESVKPRQVEVSGSVLLEVHAQEVSVRGAPAVSREHHGIVLREVAELREDTGVPENEPHREVEAAVLSKSYDVKDVDTFRHEKGEELETAPVQSDNVVQGEGKERPEVMGIPTQEGVVTHNTPEKTVGISLMSQSELLLKHERVSATETPKVEKPVAKEPSVGTSFEQKNTDGRFAKPHDTLAVSTDEAIRLDHVSEMRRLSAVPLPTPREMIVGTTNQNVERAEIMQSRRGYNPEDVEPSVISLFPRNKVKVVPPALAA